jgi:molybdenum cofactor cytidylyltransferase
MRVEPRHAALILAAGASRRLGQPKALLRRDGEALLARVLRDVCATAPERVVIVLGAAQDALRAALPASDALRDAGIECVENPDWEEGLASSLRCGARTLARHPGACLIVGCDQPALELSHLQDLLGLAAASPRGCAALDHGDRVGLPVVVPADVLVQARGLQGDRGLRDLINALPAHAFGRLVASALQRDIDTPDDLRRARADGIIDADESE